MTRTAREILEERRTIERQIAVLEGQIARCLRKGLPAGYGTGKHVEKVPGKEEYVLPPSGTNNPEGAALQHAEYCEEMIEKIRRDNAGVLCEAEKIIDHYPECETKIILRRYYLSAETDRIISITLGYERSTVSKRRAAAVQALDSEK